MTTPRTSVNELVTQLLDRQYERAAQDVLRVVASRTTEGIVAQRLSELEAEATRLASAGERLRPDNPVLRALIADLDPILTRTGQGINQASPGLQRLGVEAADVLTQRLTLGGLDGRAMAAIGERWNRVDPETVNALVGYVNSDAWRSEVGAYGSRVLETVQNQAIRGLIEGWSPLKTAEIIAEMTQSLPVSQANTMMRTLYIQSYRQGAQVYQQANADILGGQIRIAALDGRTCFPAGTLITTSDGNKPIEAIRPGEFVLTHTGNFKRVDAVMQRTYKGMAVTVKTKNTSVTATANHPILVEREGYCDWIAAEDCQIGDFVFSNLNDFSDDRNHFIGDAPIERFVGDSNYNVPLFNDPSSFSPIGFWSFMPIDAIDFYYHIQLWQKEINRITVKGSFLLKNLIKGFKTQPEIPFGFGLPCIASITSRGTELLMIHSWNNAELSFTCNASFYNRWAAANLRTMESLVLMDGKDFATSFTGGIYRLISFAGIAANFITVCIREWHGKLFATNGADFGNVPPFFATIFATEPNVVFTNFGRSQLKFAFANDANKRFSVALGDPHASTAAIQPLTTIMGGKFIPADQTRFFVHDVIISKTAKRIECEVYNLEVADDHSYLANGLAVHNCLACVALHGTRLGVGEAIHDHHNGRCVGVPYVRGVERQVRSGEEWFNGLPEAQQLQMAGPGKLELLKSGRATLRDFVQTYRDPVYDLMVRESSIKSVLGG